MCSVDIGNGCGTDGMAISCVRWTYIRVVSGKCLMCPVKICYGGEWAG